MLEDFAAGLGGRVSIGDVRRELGVRPEDLVEDVEVFDVERLELKEERFGMTLFGTGIVIDGGGGLVFHGVSLECWCVVFGGVMVFGPGVVCCICIWFFRCRLLVF